MEKTSNSSLTNHHSVFLTRRCLHGTALIETAIVLPLYMLILLGVIYFGYAGLTKQRQGAATAYAAWLPGGTQATDLLNEFWPWAGTPQGAAAQATAGDTTLALHGGQRVGDEYYNGYTDYAGNPVPPAIPIQLVAGSGFYNPSGMYNQRLPGDTGSGNDVFEQSRVAVEVWNYALGHTVQSFTWTPGQGAVQTMNTRYDDFSRYLNTNFPTGFVTADEFDPPQIGPYQVAMTAALDGSTPGTPWLQRRTVVSQATYNPPFFPQIFSDATAPPNTSFANYVTGNYPTPTSIPTSIQRFDVTGRSGAPRLAAGEGEPPQTSDTLLAQVASFMTPMADETPLPDPRAMDSRQLGAIGPNGQTMTMQSAWMPW